METLRRGLVLVLACKETNWWGWWENHSLFIFFHFLEVENPMIILTYVYLQFIPSMCGEKFERQSNLDCDMDVNILEKNGRDIGECLSVSETRYLVRSAYGNSCVSLILSLKRETLMIIFLCQSFQIWCYILSSLASLQHIKACKYCKYKTMDIQLSGSVLSFSFVSYDDPGKMKRTWYGVTVLYCYAL